MKNSIKVILIIAIILVLGIGIFLIINNSKMREKSNNYEAEKTSTKTNEIDINNTNVTTTPKTEDENSKQSYSSQNNIESISPTPTNPPPKEEEISSFSTKILNKDSNRQHNIKLTCSTLNDTIVEPGSIFSFTNTVGQATSSKGYKEADIFDANGKKKKGLGGGNCQISSTLYNAVLAVSNLPIVERHAHSNYVPYVQKGKDAAVAYGSYDFKFRNDSGSKLKIKAQASENEITITLLKLT